MVLRDVYSDMQNMWLGHHLTPNTKINSRWQKDLHKSCDTTKVLEEKIGKKISDFPHSNFVTDMSPRKGCKGKNKEMGVHPNKKLLRSWRKREPNERGTKCMGKYGTFICHWYLRQGFDLQNIQTTHMTPKQEDQQSNEKIGKGPEETVLQGGRDIWKDVQHH